MGIDEACFYDPDRVAIVPMGFCYPGKGKSGDLPPRPECAPLWHPGLFEAMSALRLTLLVGQYAQRRYLGQRASATLTETVRRFEDFLDDDILPLPHPSPRNRFWLAKNPWFAAKVLPRLQGRVAQTLSQEP
jgi:uracil-DNA glycosylase